MLTTTGHQFDAEEVRLRVPTRLDTVPRLSAVVRLAEVLEKRGLAPDTAAAIANATTDPSDFRQRLQFPISFGVPQGTLEFVFTRVWANSVVPFPTNPRVSPSLSFPVSGGDGRIPLPRPVANPLGLPELVLEVESQEAVAGTLADAVARLEMENPLAADIAADGVREPIMVVAMAIRHKDEAADVTVLAAADGSSRVAGAYRNLGLMPDAVAYRFGGNGKLLRAQVGRWLQLGEHERHALDRTAVTVLNSISLPALVVVGFQPDSATEGDLAAAIDARVGAIHVSPPREWTKGAQRDAELNAVLDHLQRLGALDAQSAAYYAGTISPAQAAATGLTSLPDIRAVDIVSDFHRRAFVRPIHEALRNIAVKQPRHQERAAVAAEAVLRSFRDEVDARQANAARNLLAHLFDMDMFRTRDWEVDREESLDDLLDAALDEWGKGSPGNAVRQLLGLAIFWLARYGIVRRTTGGGETDRRDIAAVLRTIASTRHGLIVLHRIVDDGRRGIFPRQANARGALEKEADQYLNVSEGWLRRQWAEDEDLEPGQTPPAELLLRRGRVDDALAELGRRVEELSEPVDLNGRPLVEVVGLPPSFIDALLDKWCRIVVLLSYYRGVAERSGGLPLEAGGLGAPVT